MNANQMACNVARKCAERIHSHYNEEWFNNIPAERRENYRGMYEHESLKRQIIAQNILQVSPLTQLVKVALAAMEEHGQENNEPECPICVALVSLKEQIQELFV